MGKEALIIVDMSNDFVAPDGSLTVGQPGQAIVPYIKSLAEDFVSQGKDVVVAMDAHQEDDPHFKLWPAHNVVGTEGQVNCRTGSKPTKTMNWSHTYLKKITIASLRLVWRSCCLIKTLILSMLLV